MARVGWSHKAIFDLDRIIDYIEQFDPDAADRPGCDLVDAGNSLRDYPQRGRPARGGMRELVSVNPYVIEYRSDDGLVTILGLRHAARLPRA